MAVRFGRRFVGCRPIRGRFPTFFSGAGAWRTPNLDVCVGGNTKLFFLFLCCTSFPPIPFKKFYCDILHLHDIVIPIINSVTSVNLKKAGMASRNIVMKKQYTLLWSALQYSLDFSFLVLNTYFPCSNSARHIPLLILFNMFNHPRKTTQVRILNCDLMNLPHFLGIHFLHRLLS